MEEIFVFEASNVKDLYGYTKENNIELLPQKINDKNINWAYWRTLHINENEPPRIGLDTKEMLESINTNGFYVNSISIDVQISQ